MKFKRKGVARIMTIAALKTFLTEITLQQKMRGAKLKVFAYFLLFVF